MKYFLKLGVVFLLIIMLSGCEKSFEDILTTEKWKVYSGGNEVTFEFNKDGTGQSSYNNYTPTEFKWEIDESKLLLEYEESYVSEFIISKEDGIYQLKRNEEEPLYSGEYVLTREKDFKKLYDFEDRLISKAEFDVFLIYDSNFSHGNYVEVYVTDIEDFNNIYTVSGKAMYTDKSGIPYKGTFEIQYRYDGEEIIEIDNYFSRPTQ